MIDHASPRKRPPHLRRAALFVAVSGAGWLLDTLVLMLLSGPAGWPVGLANVVSGCCGSLLVFTVAASGLFRRNDGSLLQKAAVLLLVNVPVILVSSAVLDALHGWLVAFAAGLAVVPALLRLAAKVAVTPFTLLLNFFVVRYLVERFVGLRRPVPASGRGVA